MDMKKRSIRLMLAALAVTVVAGAFAGCGSKTDEVSGNVTLAGSTALQPLAEQAGENFAAKYPGAVVTVQGGGSGTGLNLVTEGTVNIGNSDVEASKKLDKALADQLVDHKVCGIGFAVVVNKDVQVDSLTPAADTGHLHRQSNKLESSRRTGSCCTGCAQSKIFRYKSNIC